jgi:hypothetical protein
MHARLTLIACIALFVTCSRVDAQDAVAPHSTTDLPGLKKLLEELGYAPEARKAGETEFLQIDLKHSNDETRKHLIGIDSQAATIYVTGGGFSWVPDPKKASNEWFRKLLKTNHNLSPSYIFLNNIDVFGLTTVIGNVDITTERLKATLKEHLTNFDEKLTPLVKELPGKEADDNK